MNVRRRRRRRAGIGGGEENNEKEGRGGGLREGRKRRSIDVGKALCVWGGVGFGGCAERERDTNKYTIPLCRHLDEERKKRRRRRRERGG